MLYVLYELYCCSQVTEQEWTHMHDYTQTHSPLNAGGSEISVLFHYLNDHEHSESHQ